ncbi:MAG TPA: patatin-like phospholipase family protein [Acidimicrobiales bacterium]|nr:patatin-like phospholipase family protein [Acidimicrobiales bacterium]
MVAAPVIPEASNEKKADLVLEGGGVKGIGLVGAITTLASDGYTFPRIAGTSAGAIVGALLAACVFTGNDVSVITDIMKSVDYTKFRDETPLDHLGLLGEGAELLLGRGIYKGDYLLSWLAGHLENQGVTTFGDLRISDHDDPGSALPSNERYRLVVMASDVTRGELVRLPWDCRAHYDIDPDTLPIVDAVRASMSIPFFYKPYVLPGTKATFVDGGMLANFPVDIFDRPDREPRWPTFGVKLSARTEPDATMQPTSNTLQLAIACLETLIDEHDAYHLDDDKTTQRTIFVDTTGVSATNFGIDTATQDRLFASGRKGAQQFLQSWPPADFFSPEGKWLPGP